MSDDKDRQRERLAKQQQVEQNAAAMGDLLPGVWRRLYLNCVAQGFTEHESLELVKVYIAASNCHSGINMRKE